MTGPRGTGPGSGSGYAVGGRLVLTSAHVTGPVGTRVEVFHPGGTGSAGGRVVWAGTPKERDDAALVLVDDSEHWQPPTAPVRWGRTVTRRPGARCETWGVPDEAQRHGRPIEASQLRGEVNPGSGFVGNQYVMDLRTPVSGWRGGGTSPWGGLSGAAMFCDRYLTGVVAADRDHSAHGRLNVVPAYVLHHDPAFRAALAEHGAGPVGGLEPVEFQDLTDRADAPAGRPVPATPAALLEAGRQTVPFHGREDLLAEMTAWCALGGFGVWLLHGPGGQGKTRLAHHLAHLLTGDGWAVLWPRAAATTAQLLDVRRAAKPVLVVLDYAETRPEQLGALIEAAAEHPGTSPLRLLLLARTAGDWWHQATTATRQAEDHLAAARTHRLTPLEDDPGRRTGHYREAVHALAAALPLVHGLAGHDWTAAADSLPVPRHLGRDAYGNALTLHMTALADLLDATGPEPRTGGPGPAGNGGTHGRAQDVEDRLLGHESRYWRDSATARGLSPALSTATLKTALAAAHLVGAADHEHADRLWRRLPALADQPRDRRDQVTAWLATLYPSDAAPGGPPWGSLQPDRLAERHIGRTLDTDPRLADHLLTGADEGRAVQLLTVYSRAAAHPVFHQRLENHLTDLCLRHARQMARHIVTTAIRTDHPGPLIAALDAITGDSSTPPHRLAGLYGLLPHASQRLASTAARLCHQLVEHHRTLAATDPGVHLPDLAMTLNNLSVRLAEVGRRDEGLTAIEEATDHYRTLATADPGAHLTNLAMALNNLSVELGGAGRLDAGLAAIEEATDHYRTLVAADPGAHLPDLAMALTNLSVRLADVGRLDEGLAAAAEATAHYRTLEAADPGAHLPDLAKALNNLSARLGAVGRRNEGLAAAAEATAIRRTLVATNPDAHLPDLAKSLTNLSVGLGDVGRGSEGLTVAAEAVGHYRSLTSSNPGAHLPDLAMALTNLSVRLGGPGRWNEGLAAIEEATDHYRTLATANPDAYRPDLAMALNNLSIQLGEVGRWDEGLAAIEEATGHYRTLATANPDAYRPNLALTLVNLSARLGDVGRQDEGLAAAAEATGHFRTLATANPDAHRPNLAKALNNLSTQLGGAGRRDEALAAIEEATDHYRTLVAADPSAYLPDLAMALNNLSVELGGAGRRDDGLAAIEEATGHYRTLVAADPSAHRPNLALTLNNLSVELGGAGRREEGLAAVREAVAIRRSLAQVYPARFEIALQQSLNVAEWLEGLEP
ncbi:tetratricopeptide repeat protein [Streptomyces sp. BE20]|nr:tetratricopeptide repeat protein [Streptomyces sp. BE20]